MGIVLRFPGHAPASAGSAIPKRAGSARLPSASRAAEKTRKNSAGMRPRERQLLTADAPTAAKPAALAVPPNASISSPTVQIIHPEYSRYVESSSVHVSGIATSCERWLNFSMISEKDFRLAVAFRLKQLREAMDINQDELGRKLGVGGTAVSNYEKGTRSVDPFAAFKLKLTYGVPMEWLYGGDEAALSPALAAKLKIAENEIKKRIA